MKIGIEAQRLFRAKKHGMDVVALELIRRLQKRDTANEYILFAAKGPDTAGILEAPHFHTSVLRGFTYADREQLSLPRAIKKWAPDLIHCTANTAPLTGNVPLVLTLHDIIYLEDSDVSGSLYQGLGNLYRKIIVPHAIKKAASIITVSNYEQKIIAQHFPAAQSKMSVVYNGVDERFHNRYSAEEIELFRKQYALPGAFLLFLGNTAPKKNTLNIIKAYVHYSENETRPLPIVVVDYDRRRVERVLRDMNRPGLIASFIFPGYLSTEKMPLLYNCSTVFLYPSLRESFGIPIIESMACGVPVITSNSSAMPEVAGAAAVLVDPADPRAIAESIKRVLDDGALQASLREKGLVRAGHFSWDNSVEALLKIYTRYQR